MSELSGTVKHFQTFINHVFPGGALFVLLTDGEFKKLLMQLSSNMLEEQQGQGQEQYAARIVGENKHGENTFWVLSESLQLSADGNLVLQGQSPYDDWSMGQTSSFKNHLHARSSHLLTVVRASVHSAILQRFMPENFMPAMATAAACLMGANYLSILQAFGCCGVPLLTGPPGSCKSEAAKCTLALFGAHEPTAT